MDKKAHGAIPLAALAICLCGALALPDTGAGLDSRPPDSDSVSLKTGDTRIVFRPQEEFEKMILTITGPFDYLFVQEVGTGEDAVFELDPSEAVDGSYTWEVRTLPILSAEILKTLRRARATGDDSEVRALRREGSLPDRARTQGGGFRVVEGVIVLGGGPKEAAPGDSGAGGWPAEGPRSGGDVPLKADYVINNDLIVDGSACVGFDCFDGWAFSFTTIGMSEHNTRIKFDDTSYTASYPNNDWQLLANASSNGGTEKFSIIDCGDNDSQGACSGSTVFTVEAGADSHSLYVDDAGRVGFGTSTPVVELHVVDGNTPTLRLAQDGSSGFTPQTFDVAGNEANFFIRDATNGSTLPFRIQPGAPSSSLTIIDSGNVGVGTWSPEADLHIHTGTSDAANMRLSGDSAGYDLQDLNGPSDEKVAQQYVNSGVWRLRGLNDALTSQTVTGISLDLGNGNVGINEASPGYELELGSGAYVDALGRWQDASSRRYKDGITDLAPEDALEAFQALNPVSYFRKGGDPRVTALGFIAEDVPELVVGAQRQGLAPMDIVAVLTKVVQEQQKTVQEQHKTIAELSRRLAALEQAVNLPE